MLLRVVPDVDVVPKLNIPRFAVSHRREYEAAGLAGTVRPSTSNPITATDSNDSPRRQVAAVGLRPSMRRDDRDPARGRSGNLTRKCDRSVHVHALRLEADDCFSLLWAIAACWPWLQTDDDRLDRRLLRLQRAFLANRSCPCASGPVLAVVPLYSTISPTASSAGRSRCKRA